MERTHMVNKLEIASGPVNVLTIIARPVSRMWIVVSLISIVWFIRLGFPQKHQEMLQSLFVHFLLQNFCGKKSAMIHTTFVPLWLKERRFLVSILTGSNRIPDYFYPRTNESNELSDPVEFGWRLNEST